MPVLTPIMPAQVPCDGNWHKIHITSNIFAHVFVKFNGGVCKFTARLIDNPQPPAPGGAPAPPNVKKEMVIPTAGGWRGLNAIFDDFEVKCEPVVGDGGGNPTEEEQQRPPEVQASRKKGDPPPAIHECPFEWYMSIS
ncbi:hypothetical protein [Muriicola sp. Z0-33]|uniref:hypothetical protein n=1 Tax=Muriicola sp. Z0-33 TaxID=2816957 RepID=UPI0022375992|nr:hypothetical protein [Muriicola sp. Z0-33]MCW5518059.1 hypothetical protein [Muriicola sp. Z0-33]